MINNNNKEDSKDRDHDNEVQCIPYSDGDINVYEKDKNPLPSHLYNNDSGTDLNTIRTAYTSTYWLTIAMTIVIIINTLVSFSTSSSLLGVHNFVLISAVSVMILLATVQSYIYTHVLLSNDLDSVCGMIVGNDDDKNNYHFFDLDMSNVKCELGETSANIRKAFLYQFIGGSISIVLFVVTSMYWNDATTTTAVPASHYSDPSNTSTTASFFPIPFTFEPKEHKTHHHDDVDVIGVNDNDSGNETEESDDDYFSIIISV